MQKVKPNQKISFHADQDTRDAFDYLKSKGIVVSKLLKDILKEKMEEMKKEEAL